MQDATKIFWWNSARDLRNVYSKWLDISQNLFGLRAFFKEQMQPTSDIKVLLLLGNYESPKYYPALEYTTKNNVWLYSHITHNVIYIVVENAFWRDIFQKTHPGRINNHYDIARLLAFLKTAVVINAVHEFERPRIWFVNKHTFGAEHFAPAVIFAGTSSLNT